MAVTTHDAVIPDSKSFNVCVVSASFLINDAYVVSGPSWIKSVTIGDYNNGTNNGVYISGTAPDVPQGTSNTHSVTLYVEDVWGEQAQNVTVDIEVFSLWLEHSPSGNPTIKVGDSLDIVFTANPSGLGTYDWSLAYTDQYDCISSSIISRNGNKATVRVTALSADRSSDQFSIKCTVGGDSVTSPQLVYLTEEAGTVTQIEITGPEDVESEGTATFVAVTSPSNAENRHVTWSKTSTGSSYYSIQSQTDTSTGGRCVIKAERTTAQHRCMIKCESEDGAAVAYHTFDILSGGPILVESISITGDNHLTTSSMNYLFTAVSYPSDASDRHVTWSIVSGASYIEIERQVYTSSGGRVYINARGKEGTAVLRATADDDGGAYADITIYVEPPPKSIHMQSASGGQVGDTVTAYVGGTGMIYSLAVTVYPLDEEYEVVIQSGSAVELLTSETGYYRYRVNPVAVGTSVLRAYLVSDPTVYDELTFVVEQFIQSYPSDRTVSRTYTYGVQYGNGSWVSMANLVGSNKRYHGGYVSVDAPDGMRFYLGNGQYADSLPPASEGGVVTASGYIYLDGTPTQIGQSITIYGESDSETVRIQASIRADGTFTKTLHFDANVPSGASLSGSMPADITKDHVGETTEFELPECTATVEGYVFFGWSPYVDVTHAAGLRVPGQNYVVEGESQTVTLYAEWFPVPEGFEYTGGTTFRCNLEAGVEVDIDIPNRGDYPVLYQPTDDAEIIEGVTFVTPTGSYTGVIPQVRLTSGIISMEGMPSKQLGTPCTLMSWGQRAYNVFYEIYVAAGQLPEPGEPLTYTLNANGGKFPDGSGSITRTIEGSSYLLPDFSVVDRPGYRLAKWVGADSGEAAMGSRQMVLDTWTAQWSVDDRGYNTEFLPHAAVRIYRAIDQWIDATYLQAQGGEAVVNLAENSKGDISMTLLSDWRVQGENLMSDSCTLWSSGPAGAVRTGMYVRVEDIREDGTVEYVADGFITTITPGEGTVDIVAADWITMLSKMGSTYRRNFYGTSRTSELFDAGSDTTGLYADLGGLEDFTIDGHPYWKVLTETETEGDDPLTILSGGTTSRTSYTLTLSMPDTQVLDDITVPVAYNGQNVPGTYTFGLAMIVRSGSEQKSYLWNKTINSTGSLQREDISLTGMNLEVVDDTVEVTFELNSYIGAGGYGNVYLYRDGSGGPVAMTLVTGVWNEITAYTGPTQGKLYVTEIDGVSSLEDASLYTPSEDRVKIPYVTGTQTVGAIMESISEALGIMPLVMVQPGGDAELVMFRTGGGYALDYFQKLADVASADGLRRAFAVRGYTTPVLVASSRHALADASYAHIHYGGDSVTGSEERIAYASFSPSLTFKNRPNLVMVRGTMSDRGSSESVPIMVAVEDSISTDRRYGIVIENVLADSSVNRLVDAASTAWATLRENDLDQWEGSVTIPGIRRDMIPATGQYAGSGVCLLVTDTRMGIVGAHVRVKQIRLDYSACTTTITLTNYSLIHSSAIADTTALAITSADVATGDNSTTLFNTQYVRIKTNTPQTIEESGNVVVGWLGSGKSFSFRDVAVLQFPNGRSVLVATAPSDNMNHADDDRPYDVVSVVINGGAQLRIDPIFRPDYYQGQTLILNVDFATQ